MKGRKSNADFEVLFKRVNRKWESVKKEAGL